MLQGRVGASFFAVEMHARQGNNEDGAWALLLACSLAQDTPQPPAFLFANADMFRRCDQVKLVRKSSPQHDDQAGIEVDEAGGVEDEDLDVFAGSENMVKSAVTNVISPSIATDDPD